MVHAQHTTLTQRTTTYNYDDLARLIQIMTGDERHSEAANSTLDVIWTLYDRILNVNPSTADSPRRDLFYLSKGHGPMSFYAVLAAKGFLSTDDLSTFGGRDSILGHHPDRMLVPGVDVSSGSLGHGLALSVGAALAMSIDGYDGDIYCLIGDGELDEGSNSEAIALAGRFGLSRLTVIVIDNNSSLHGWPGGITSRFEVEGWSATVVDGRDLDDIERGFRNRTTGTPNVLVAQVGNRYV